MLAELNQQFPIVKSTYDAASAVLGLDLWSIVQNGPQADLNRTECTQPAMLAGGVAALRVWKEMGGATPDIVAGHSLGEYSALVCAEALSFDDAVEAVQARAKFMQEAVPEGVGAIAAVLGLDDDAIIEVCREAGADQHVAAVNFNAPGQVVVAGHAEAVDRAIELASERGAKRAIRLPLSVPAHCQLMQPAAERFREVLAELEFQPPTMPVLHNIDVAPRSSAEDIREALVQQVYSPVRWADTVKQFAVLDVQAVVELGPGKVLTGLVRRIDRSLNAMPVFDPGSLDKALSQTGGDA